MKWHHRYPLAIPHTWGCKGGSGGGRQPIFASKSPLAAAAGREQPGVGRKEPSPSNGAGAERGIQPRCACFHPAVRLQDPSCRTGTQRHFQSSPIHLQCRSRGILLHKGLRLPSSGCFPMAPAPGMSERDMAQAHVNAVDCPR